MVGLGIEEKTRSGSDPGFNGSVSGEFVTGVEVKLNKIELFHNYLISAFTYARDAFFVQPITKSTTTPPTVVEKFV